MPIPLESKRMLNRLKEYEQETLLFLLDFDVPFTNDLAERDIIMPKANKGIGRFQNRRWSKAFARIRGFVPAVKKKGKKVIDGIVSIFSGNYRGFLYPDRR